MKKIFAILTALALAASVAACGNAGLSNTASDTNTKENAQKLHAVRMIEKYYTWLNEEEVGILERMLEDLKRRKREYAIDEE